MSLLKLEKNTLGTDWFVGDMHGDLDKFQTFLQHSGFDLTRDRLIAVGDLVDRGPDPAGLLEFFGQNPAWFFSCLGNHDAMMLETFTNPDEGQRTLAGTLWFRNGGDWIEKIQRSRLDGMLAALQRMPLAIEVELANGLKAGVVHAEFPLHSHWSAVSAVFLDGDDIINLSDRMGACLLWSRRRFRAANAMTQNRSARSIKAEVAAQTMKLLAPVPGIDLLITGHTRCIPQRPQWIENLMWIDTGAGYRNGVLSFVNPVNGECFQAYGRNRHRRIQISRLSLEGWRAKAAHAAIPSHSDDF